MTSRLEELHASECPADKLLEDVRSGCHDVTSPRVPEVALEAQVPAERRAAAGLHAQVGHQERGISTDCLRLENHKCGLGSGLLDRVEDRAEVGPGGVRRYPHLCQASAEGGKVRQRSVVHVREAS